MSTIMNSGAVHSKNPSLKHLKFYVFVAVFTFSFLSLPIKINK